MLSTKNIVEKKSLSKNLYPGVQQCKINSIVLEQGYNLGSYKLVLNLESEDRGDDFEGFFLDGKSQTGPRYRGQVSKVRFHQYMYEDREYNGMKFNRDQDILKALKSLSVALNKTAMLDSIEASTIEEFVEKASVVLSGNTFLNFCIGGKEYLDKNGYTKHDLFIPAYKAGEVGFEALGVATSKLAKFNEDIHIIKMKKADTVQSFEPTQGIGDDFDL